MEKEDIKIIIPQAAGLEGAFDSLKKDPAAQEALKGFRVKEVKIQGSNLIRHVEIWLFKEKPSEEEMKEAFRSLLESIAEVSEKMLKDLEKGNAPEEPNND